MKLILSTVAMLALSMFAHAGSQDYDREIILKKLRLNPVVQAAAKEAKRLAKAKTCDFTFESVTPDSNSSLLNFKININCLNQSTDAMGQVQVEGSLNEESNLSPELDIRIRFAG